MTDNTTFFALQITRIVSLQTKCYFYGLEGFFHVKYKPKLNLPFNLNQV